MNYRKITTKIRAILLGIILGLCMVQARTVLAAEVTIQLSDLGTSMEGVEFTISKDAFSISGKTNAAGSVTFSNLENGEYLVEQTNTASYGRVSAFSVTLPYQVEDVQTSQVLAKPKGELFPPKTETSESVFTGDHSNAVLYLILASAILVYGAVVVIYKKKKHILHSMIGLILLVAVIGANSLAVFAAESVPEWATNVTIENPPDDQYVYQFSDSCSLYQRGQYRFGCGNYNCAPSPILLLIDGSEYNEASGKTWTANSVEYVPGVSNYELAYCADFDTSTVVDQFYKKVNVEDSTYFERVEDAYKLRAIVGNTYPFVSAVDMVKDLYEKNVITDGSILLNGKTFTDELTTADIDVGQLIAATQMAVWVTCNDTMDSASVAAGRYTYYTLHPDNTSMQPQGKLNQINGYPNANDEENTRFSMTEGQAANINAIYDYLMALDPVTEEEADQNQQLVITDVDYEATKTGDGTYDVAVKTILNTAIKKNDNLTIKVSASNPDSAGNVIEDTKVFDGKGSGEVIGKEVNFELKGVPSGSTITIELSGDQYLNQGVYFYEPYVTEGETERTTAQNLVGASVGYTPVKAKASFPLDDVETIALLPSTGGVGTVPFYVVGGIMMVGGAACLHRRKLCGRK